MADLNNKTRLTAGKPRSVRFRREWAALIPALSGAVPAVSRAMASSDWDLLVGWVTGLVLGAVILKSSLCFAASVRDPLLTGDTSQSRALILATAVSTPLFAAAQFQAQAAGAPVPGHIYPVGIHTIAGGIAFGFGMVFTGGCASGVLVRAGDGFLSQWVALLGLGVGSLLGAWNWNWWYPHVVSRSPTVYLGSRSPLRVAALQTAALMGAYVALRHLEQRRFGDLGVEVTPRLSQVRRLTWKEPWPYWVGGLAVGLLNSLLVHFIGRPWGVTAELTALVAGLGSRLCNLRPSTWTYFADESRKALLETPPLSRTMLYVNAGVLAGAMSMSIALDQFRLRRPPAARSYAASFVGGVIMGYSARLALGCTVGAVLSGIPSLSLHGWVFLPGLFVGAHLANLLILLRLRASQTTS